jgi:predicted DNA-binding protein with PD1-like motif
MAIQNWDTKTSRIVYRRFQPGESLIEALESLARSEGIREAIVTSCIGSLSELKLRNLCRYDEGVPEFQRQVIDENLELVSAEGYIQPLPDGGIRVHIHVAAARPSGEMVGGHCEDATVFTGAFMYIQVVEEETRS